MIVMELMGLGDLSKYLWENYRYINSTTISICVNSEIVTFITEYLETAKCIYNNHACCAIQFLEPKII